MEAVNNASSQTVLIDAATKAGVKEQSNAPTTSHAAASQQSNITAPAQVSNPTNSSKEDAVNVAISDEAKQAGVENKKSPTAVVQQSQTGSDKEDEAGLSDEEKKEVERLKARDREVRTHEQAHLSALGSHKSGGASFTYETGPDGNRYAVAGEVPVNLSEEETPEKTIQKAQTIRRAALAPAEPSSADRAVAAQASQMEARARAELTEERSEELESGESTNKPKLAGAPKESPATEEQNAAEEAVEAQADELEPETEDITAKLIGKFQTPKSCPVCGGADDGHSHYEAVS